MSKPEETKPETTESVADLPVNSEQAEEIEAGRAGSFHAFPGFNGGVYVAAGDVN